MHLKTHSLILAVLCLASARAPAETEAEAMQRQLNQQVMAAPFNAGDIDKAAAEADVMLKNKVRPVTVAPSYWQPGWNCGYMTSYQYYNYSDYRNCVYHYRYYGRYW